MCDLDPDLRRERLDALYVLAKSVPPILLCFDAWVIPHPYFGEKRNIFVHAAHDPWFQVQDFTYYMNSVRHDYDGSATSGDTACVLFFGIGHTQVNILMSSKWCADRDDLALLISQIAEHEDLSQYPASRFKSP